MKGNRILLSPDPKGRFVEGVVKAGQTFYPGMCVQPDLTIATNGNRYTYGYYDADADGGRPKGAHWIVLEDIKLGKTATDPFVAGERFQAYAPQPGDELNLYLGDVAGTADSHTAGEMLIIEDGTGEFIATTGSPEAEVAQLRETLSALTADTHGHCEWTGY